ncbi:hypothetical protein [Catenulispora subtropica]|uniref:Uncharacterized protein n=1 Tax=Catenulispora subtropica TaxID=450798 RepID=A0ABP5ENA4_9ACTN
MATTLETSQRDEAPPPAPDGAPPPVRPYLRRRLLRWLGRWLDVRRIVPWWRRQGAAVRTIVVIGVLVGWPAPAAMVRHGWHSAEFARGLTGDQGFFTATTCLHIYPSNEGNPGQYFVCDGTFDSPSTHLPSTRAQSTYDLATGVPTRARIVDHEVETVDNGDAAASMAAWTILAFLVAVFEATVLTVLVLAVRGGPHSVGPGMRVFIITFAMIPGVFVVALLSDLAFRIYFGLSS